MTKLSSASAYSERSDFLVDLPISTRNGSRARTREDYQREVREARLFYRHDAIASTVVNRICDIGITALHIKRGRCTDAELAFYRSFRQKLNQLLKAAALDFLLSGMALPEYTTSRQMGNTFFPDLGRRRYTVPDTFFLRNSDNILLKRNPTSLERRLFLELTSEELNFIKTGGKFSDGTTDIEAFQAFARRYPQYVDLVLKGNTRIPLTNSMAVLRKPLSWDDWPQPYLTPAIPHMRHKQRIKEMDYSIATKALEAIRLIRAGSDEFPVTEGDKTLDDLEQKLREKPAASVYNLFANHTVTIDWVFPPLDALMSEGKYAEPNSDIFLALGFSRALLVGESLRSNAGGSSMPSLGPLATVNDLRHSLLAWVVWLYERLANENSFANYPQPYLRKIRTNDLLSLIAFALEALEKGVISRDTVAAMYDEDFNEELEQIESEPELEVTGVSNDNQ